jgi:hypothetical protein
MSRYCLMLVASHEIHNFVAICYKDDEMSKREGQWIGSCPRSPIIRLQPFACYCDPLYVPASSSHRLPRLACHCRKGRSPRDVRWLPPQPSSRCKVSLENCYVSHPDTPSFQGYSPMLLYEYYLLMSKLTLDCKIK